MTTQKKWVVWCKIQRYPWERIGSSRTKDGAWKKLNLDNIDPWRELPLPIRYAVRPLGEVPGAKDSGDLFFEVETGVSSK